MLGLGAVRQTAVGTQPPGYALFRTITLSIARLSLVSSLLVWPLALLFTIVTRPLGGPVDLTGNTINFHLHWVDWLLIVVVGMAGTVMFHELLHGLVARWFGAQPHYGLGPGIAFCHYREMLRVKATALLLAAPLVVLTAVGLVLIPLIPLILRGPLLVGLIVNSASAVGDLAALWQLRQTPPGALVAQTRFGYEVFCRQEGADAETIAPA